MTVSGSDAIWAMSIPLVLDEANLLRSYDYLGLNQGIIIRIDTPSILSKGVFNEVCELAVRLGVIPEVCHIHLFQ